MFIIYICISAYAILIIRDILSLSRKIALSLIFFISGIVLLSFCTLFVMWTSDFISVLNEHPIYCVVTAIIAGLFQVLFLYSLFFALPAKETYTTVNNLKLVDTGMYAICRHPGVIWLALFYLFTWLSVGNIMMLWLGIASTALNIIYVAIQDIYIFPRTIDKYDEYKKTTPFLIPSVRSFKRAIKSSRRRVADEKVTQ